MGLAVKDGDFRLRGNPHQCGFGLDADTDTPKGGEFAGGLGDGEHGGAITDPENRATLPGIADQIASAETEGMIIHGLVVYGGKKWGLGGLGLAAGVVSLGPLRPFGNLFPKHLPASIPDLQRPVCHLHTVSFPLAGA